MDTAKHGTTLDENPTGDLHDKYHPGFVSIASIYKESVDLRIMTTVVIWGVNIHAAPWRCSIKHPTQIATILSAIHPEMF